MSRYGLYRIPTLFLYVNFLVQKLVFSFSSPVVLLYIDMRGGAGTPVVTLLGFRMNTFRTVDENSIFAQLKELLTMIFPVMIFDKLVAALCLPGLLLELRDLTGQRFPFW